MKKKLFTAFFVFHFNYEKSSIVGSSEVVFDYVLGKQKTQLEYAYTPVFELIKLIAFYFAKEWTLLLFFYTKFYTRECRRVKRVFFIVCMQKCEKRVNLRVTE